MNEGARSRALLTVTALAAGVLGELLSPALFGYGPSVDGVIALQMLFIGLILSGFYITVGKIRLGRGGTQSPSGSVPEEANAETPGASAETFQARPSRNTMSHTSTLMGIVAMALVYLFWLAVEAASNGPLSEFPHFLVEILVDSSLFAGMFLTLTTICLRVGKDFHHYKMVKTLSSIILILTALSWAFAQRTVYAMLLEILGYLETSDYVALARLSSEALLAFVSIFWIGLALLMYFSRPRGNKTLEPAQKPA